MDEVPARRRWQRLLRASHLDELPVPIRRVMIGVLGGTVLALGLAMVVLPGPALVLIPLGLAILATEFAWARRAIKKARSLLRNAKEEVTGR